MIFGEVDIFFHGFFGGQIGHGFVSGIEENDSALSKFSLA